MGSRGINSGISDKGGYPGGFEQLEKDLDNAKTQYNKRYNFRPGSDIYKQFDAYGAEVKKLQTLYDKEKTKPHSKTTPKKNTWKDIEKRADKFTANSKYYYTTSNWQKNGEDRTYINFRLPNYRNQRPGGYWDNIRNVYVPPKSGIDLSKD